MMPQPNPEITRPRTRHQQQNPAGQNRPTPITDEIAEAASQLSHTTHRLVVLAGRLSGSDEWQLAGAPTAAHHLSAAAQIEPSTARDWLRVARCLEALPLVAARFSSNQLSYSKVRALITIADGENESELVALAERTPAGDLRAALARWLDREGEPEDLAAFHHRQRSLSWRTEPDGMVSVHARLPPLRAARLTSALSKLVMTARRRDRASGEPWPTVAQQHADALDELLDATTRTETEIVVHVRADGCTTSDGTPVPRTVIAKIADEAFIRALIHDAEGKPIDATNRRRRPTRRQRRLVESRDRACVDCGRRDLLEFDHDPPFDETGRTVTGELRLRCGPCHRSRHGPSADQRAS